MEFYRCGVLSSESWLTLMSSTLMVIRRSKLFSVFGVTTECLLLQEVRMGGFTSSPGLTILDGSLYWSLSSNVLSRKVVSPKVSHICALVRMTQFLLLPIWTPTFTSSISPNQEELQVEVMKSNRM